MKSSTSHRAPVPGDLLLHPVALSAVAVLAVNDHFAKAYFDNWWTGKISDFAGMVFFPIFLISVKEVLASLAGPSWKCTRRDLLGSISATLIVFSLINVSTGVGALYVSIVQWLKSILAVVTDSPVAHVVDPSDLLALPLLIVPWLLAQDRLQPGASKHSTLKPTTGSPLPQRLDPSARAR